MDAVDRFRSLAELLADPVLTAYKSAVPATLGSSARTVLYRHCRLLLTHCWALLEAQTGIKRGHPFCVVYHGSRYCALTVTPDVDKAIQVAMRWHGSPASVALVNGDCATVFDVTARGDLVQRISVTGHAEAWLAMTLALVYSPPEWLRPTAALGGGNDALAGAANITVA